MHSLIVACDPGLANVGLAVFNGATFMEKGGGTRGAARALLGTATLRTHTREEDAYRLRSISHQLAQALKDFEARWKLGLKTAIVERPSTAQDYSARPASARRDLNRFYQARGVCLACFARHGATIVEQSAGMTPKAERRRVLDDLWRSMGAEACPGSNEHERDAIWQGFWHLTYSRGAHKTAIETPPRPRARAREG